VVKSVVIGGIMGNGLKLNDIIYELALVAIKKTNSVVFFNFSLALTSVGSTID
jgi:hypothetical protein